VSDADERDAFLDGLIERVAYTRQVLRAALDAAKREPS